MNSRFNWLAGGVAIVFLFLAAHVSSRPLILGRYSLSYFLFLLAFVAIAVGGLMAYRRGRWSGTYPETIDLPVADRFLDANSRWFTLAICAVHILLVLIYLPPGRVFSSEPILEIDYAHHYHQVASVVETLAREGRHWAWDTSFCAGYPLGTLFDVDMKLFQIVAYALSTVGADLAIVYNCLILTCFVAVPFLLIATCRNFRLRSGSAVLILATGVLLWHSHPLFRNFNGAGLCTFVFGTYLSMLVVSLFFRFLDEGGWSIFLLLLCALSAAFLTHITMPLLLAAPLAVVYVLYFKTAPLARHGALLAAVAGALAVNAWWIVTALRFFEHRVTTTFFAPPSATELIAAIVAFEEPDLFLAVLGIWGYASLIRWNKAFALVGIASVFSFFALAKLTRGVPILETLEPLRFMIPLAVYSMAGFVTAVHRVAVRHAGGISLRSAVPVLLPSIFFVGTYMTPRTVFDDAFRSQTNALLPIVRWIESHTDNRSRIAFLDDSPGDMSAARLRYHVDRQLIGGPFSQMNLEHSFASFTPFRFFDRRLSDLSQADLRRYAELYNVRWIITSTADACLAFISLAPAADLVARFTVDATGARSAAIPASSFASYKGRRGESPICVFETDAEPSFLLKADGVVEAGLNRIAVSGASPGRVVLKYHWLPTLATSPTLPIREYRIEGLPVGFIEIENGTVADFAVYNSYVNQDRFHLLTE